MSYATIDGHMLRKMIIAGANALERDKQIIDSLNVFPVPDGDTGTNMSLTILAAGREVEKLNTANASEVAKAASSGSLRGARGNSGVILSQLFRGFARGIDDNAVVNTEVLGRAFEKAAETAYKAVMKPKEGTILTVARAIAEKAAECAYETDDLREMMKEIIIHAKIVLERTTQMLPELRQAGVVDAGGKGLICILEGAMEAAASRNKDIVIKLGGEYPRSAEAVTPVYMPVASANVEIEFGYCTEYFINVDKVTDEIEDSLKEYLSSIGDSIVVVGDEDIIKIHVHTNHPGDALEFSLKVGTLSNLKIENMRIQHTSLIEAAENGHTNNVIPMHKEKKDVGFVAVAVGEGIVDLMKGLGADEIIQGGQTMNPSTDDILSAIERVHAKEVFVLPNNKNIILAAQQAQELSTETNVHLIPTKTIPQGITALVNYVQGNSVHDNIAHMKNSIESVRTGQITYAVRDTKIDDLEIKEGDVLCMIENKIELVSSSIQQGAMDLIDKMVQEEGELLSIYYGEDVSSESANELLEYVQELYPDLELELQYGAQPLYYYIISVE